MKTLTLVLISVPLALLLFMTTAPTAKADPDWWDSNWQYRRPITITGEHPENYQIKIVIPYDSDMKSDYSDLRFTENETGPLLSYWIENYTADNATVWVRRIDNTQQDIDNVIYVYYGNPTATSMSNPENTMLWWDDFSTDTSANYQVLSGSWTWDTANGFLICTSSGRLLLRDLTIDNVEVVGDFLQNQWSTGVLLRYQDLNNHYHFSCDPTGSSPNSQIGKRVNGDYSTLVTGAYPPSGTWTKWTIRAYGSTLYFKNGDYGTLNTNDTTFTSGEVALLGDVGDTKYYDNLVIRKYTSPEPTVTVGAEERALPTQPTPYLLINGVCTNDNTPYFEWENGSNADNHRLLIDNDPDFSSPNENKVIVNDNSYTIPDENSLPDDNYSWKVVAVNASGETSSSTWTFIVDTLPPLAPSLSSPSDNSGTSDQTPTFSWSGSDNTS
ncbi:MAG TPA: DUF2341 domain-containing protein, partial [Hadesarchaea archaeon]|nr:DUF2341 domain-containing protein [Hadesarchaea archaeon]